MLGHQKYEHTSTTDWQSSFRGSVYPRRHRFGGYLRCLYLGLVFCRRSRPRERAGSFFILWLVACGISIFGYVFCSFRDYRQTDFDWRESLVCAVAISSVCQHFIRAGFAILSSQDGGERWRCSLAKRRCLLPLALLFQATSQVGGGPAFFVRPFLLLHPSKNPAGKFQRGLKLWTKVQPLLPMASTGQPSMASLQRASSSGVVGWL